MVAVLPMRQDGNALVRSGWRSATALLALYLLVLQALLVGFTLGAHAASLQRDAFGQIICTAEGGKTLPGEPGHKALPECCGAGCMATAFVFATPPVWLAVAPVPPETETSLRYLLRKPVPTAASRLPAQARAPPRAV